MAAKSPLPNQASPFYVRYYSTSPLKCTFLATARREPLHFIVVNVHFLNFWYLHSEEMRSYESFTQVVESGNKSPLRESVYKNMQHEHKKRPTLQQVYNSKIQLSRKTLQPPPPPIKSRECCFSLWQSVYDEKVQKIQGSFLECTWAILLSSLNGINRGRS